MAIFTKAENTDWRETLEAWLHVCGRAASGHDQKECLDFLLSHLAAAPTAVVTLIGDAPDRAHIDQLVDLGAFDSAVAELLDNAALGYMISKPMAGTAICTTTIAGSMDEMSFEALSAPMARIGAAAKAMIAIAGGARGEPSADRKRLSH